MNLGPYQGSALRILGTNRAVERDRPMERPDKRPDQRSTRETQPATTEPDRVELSEIGKRLAELMAERRERLVEQRDEELAEQLKERLADELEEKQELQLPIERLRELIVEWSPTPRRVLSEDSSISHESRGPD